MTSEHGRFLYRAKVARELLARREARSFLARVFDGAIAPALMHLVDEVDLSPEQIDELKQILDRETRR